MRWLLLITLILPASAVASPGEELLDLLSATRIEEAAARVDSLPAEDPWTPAAQAAWAFHRGDYPATLEALQSVPGSGEVHARIAWLKEAAPRSLAATEGMQERRDEHFIYRWDAGTDEVLVEYAADALEGQRQALADLLGVRPSQPTVVEFFPNVDRFVTASTLPQEWVRTTGTVAIAKWDRMLVLSPRNMARGYAWLDTLAHEYTHLALARASRNAAPIWFQEGAAKVLESAWRGGDRSTWLDPRSETLLAEALAEDRLISFAAMHPSMAALPSSRDAAQAFAQVAYAVSWLLDEAGDKGFRRIAEATGLHGDVLRAIDQVLGRVGGSFEKRYQRRLRVAGLVRKAAPIYLDKELKDSASTQEDPDAKELDPVLLADRAMQDKTRIGDLLRLRGHNEAAVLEYERAEGVSSMHSPALANKHARALRALGRVEEATDRLKGSVSEQPEYTPTVALLAKLLSQQSLDAAALHWGHRAIGLNPFDPEVHEALLASCDRLADTACLERERRVLRLLRGEPTSTERP